MSAAIHEVPDLDKGGSAMCWVFLGESTRRTCGDLQPVERHFGGRSEERWVAMT